MTRIALATILLTACALDGARAQALADPTRPPAMLAKRPAAVGASAPPPGPVLQSVLISREAGGRQIAVIDGETVRLGGAYHGAQLVRMTQTEVELKRGSGRQILKLSAEAGPKAPAPVPR